MRWSDPKVRIFSLPGPNGITNVKSTVACSPLSFEKPGAPGVMERIEKGHRAY